MPCYFTKFHGKLLALDFIIPTVNSLNHVAPILELQIIASGHIMHREYSMDIRFWKGFEYVIVSRVARNVVNADIKQRTIGWQLFYEINYRLDFLIHCRPSASALPSVARPLLCWLCARCLLVRLRDAERESEYMLSSE